MVLEKKINLVVFTDIEENDKHSGLIWSTKHVIFAVQENFFDEMSRKWLHLTEFSMTINLWCKRPMNVFQLVMMTMTMVRLSWMRTRYHQCQTQTLMRHLRYESQYSFVKSATCSTVLRFVHWNLGYSMADSSLDKLASWSEYIADLYCMYNLSSPLEEALLCFS